MTFRAVLKIAAKVFLGFFLLAALLLAWAMFVNRHDEPLTPEAQAILSYRAEAVPDAGNGYVAMAGFTAPAGSDWKKAGIDWIERHNERSRASGRGMTGNATHVSLTEEERKLKFSEDNCCEQFLKLSWKTDATALSASLSSLPQQRERLDRLLSANVELILRYETMQAAPAFSETALLSWTMMPQFSDYIDIIRVRRLLLSKAALSALSGDQEPVLDFLERDLRFWRLVMRSDTTLLTAMIAQAQVGEDLRLLQALLPRIDLSVSTAERWRRLLAPFSAEERSLLRALKIEWNYIAEGVLHLREFNANHETCAYFPDSGEGVSCTPVQNFLMKWFFQPQATLNLHVEKLRFWSDLARLPPPEFVARYAELNEQRRKNETEIRVVPWPPYNFIGRTMAEFAEVDVGDYIGRRHDHAAMLQLTRAQLELRLAGIDVGKNPQAVPEFLAKAGEETRNPYTGMTFDWNENCRRLSFTPQDGKRRIFSEITLADIPEQNAAACAASAAASPIHNEPGTTNAESRAAASSENEGGKK